MTKDKDYDKFKTFLKDKISFSVNINYIDGKKRYVVIQPYINIQNYDTEKLEFIKDFLEVNRSNINNNKLAIQSIDDIEIAISILDKYDFYFKEKSLSFAKFKKVFKLIQELDSHVLKDFDDGVIDIVKQRLLINEKNRIKLTASQEIKKIRDFFKWNK